MAWQSTPMARMEYCGEPWGRTPSWASGTYGKGAERGTRSGGAAAPHGRLLHGVTGFVTLRRKQVPCHNGEPGPRPDTPGSTERLWQAAPGQVTLD